MNDTGTFPIDEEMAGDYACHGAPRIHLVPEHLQTCSALCVRFNSTRNSADVIKGILRAAFHGHGAIDWSVEGNLAFATYENTESATLSGIASFRHVAVARNRGILDSTLRICAAVNGSTTEGGTENPSTILDGAKNLLERCLPGEFLLNEQARLSLGDTLSDFCENASPPRLRSKRRNGSLTRVRWYDHRLKSVDSPPSALVLSIVANENRYRYRIRRGSDDEATASGHFERDIDLNQVRATIHEILSLASDCNHLESPSDSHLRSMRSAGRRLNDLLLTPDVRSALHQNGNSYLQLHLDDDTVGIPWELIHDGEDFIGRRFIVGRMVSTRESVKTMEAHPATTSLTALIVADPQGNLPGASREGSAVKHALSAYPDVRPAIFAGHVTCRDLLEHLPQHSLVHYCGHAEYNNDGKKGVGLCLADGTLTPEEIRHLGGGGNPMPSLVFINACESAQTSCEHGKRVRRIHGIADAFLLAGTRHVIGTLWEIQDEPATRIATSFYQALARGDSVGTALRGAQGDNSQTPNGTFLWAAYVLYGDPARTFFDGIDDAFERIPQQEIYDELAGRTRSMRGRSLSARARFWISAAAVLLITVGVAAGVSKVMNRSADSRPVATVPELPTVDREARTQQQIALLGDLIDKGLLDREPPSPEGDEWTSPVIGVALLPFREGKPQPQIAPLLSRVEDFLYADPRLVLVDRRILEYVLSEMQLTGSDLTDPARTVRLGRIVSARILISPTVLEDQDGVLLSLKAVDTESTQILPLPLVPLHDLQRTSRDSDAAKIVGEIRALVEEFYPLRGIVRHQESGVFSIDLGADHGIRNDMKMTLKTQTGTTFDATAVEVSSLYSTLRIADAPNLGEETRVNASIHQTDNR